MCFRFISNIKVRPMVFWVLGIDHIYIINSDCYMSLSPRPIFVLLPHVLQAARLAMYWPLQSISQINKISFKENCPYRGCSQTYKRKYLSWTKRLVLSFQWHIDSSYYALEASYWSSNGSSFIKYSPPLTVYANRLGTLNLEMFCLQKSPHASFLSPISLSHQFVYLLHTLQNCTCKDWGQEEIHMNIWPF